VSEDSACLRPLGYHDRHEVHYYTNFKDPMLNGPGIAYNSSFCGYNVGLNLRNKNRGEGYKFIFTLKDNGQFIGKLWEKPSP
jgi:hypothetical protein